jgi:hypothetical protein
MKYLTTLKFGNEDHYNYINKRFVEHIAKAYFFDVVGGDELFKNMLKITHRTFTAHLIQFVGQYVLGQHKKQKLTRLNLNKVKNIWENQKLKEYSQFG